MLSFKFTNELIEWRGPSPFHFIAVPSKQSAEIKDGSLTVTYGWGVIPATVTSGDTQWTTSLIPREGLYLIPVKDAVRKKLEVEIGDRVKVLLEIAPPKGKTK